MITPPSLVRLLVEFNTVNYTALTYYHSTVTLKDSILHKLYGESPVVNSAHHQAIKELGSGLSAIQWCPDDNCIEAIVHTRLPILGVQWHPERIDEKRAMISGQKLLTYFVSLIPSSRE